MELLINELMRLGADRRRLRAKVFGGADLLGFGSSRIGTRNSEFVKSFLALEGIPVLSQRLGGHLPVQVRFYTGTGRALVRAVRQAGEPVYTRIAEAENQYRAGVESVMRGGQSDITLF